MKFYIGMMLAGITITSFATTIYECVDSSGMSVFGTKNGKNCKKAELAEISVYAAPITQSDYQARGYTKKVPSYNKSNNSNSNGVVAKVYVKGTGNLGTNETGRTQILNEELGKEKLALTDSQQALVQAQKTKLQSEQNNPELYKQRIQALQDAVTEHQKNIEILSKQLGVRN
jgi:DNA mismatch repair ATPase MutS